MITLLKLAFFVLVVLVILAFIGVQPLTGYKDSVFGKLSDIAAATKSNTLPLDIVLTKVYSVNGERLAIDVTVSPSERPEAGTIYPIRQVNTAGDVVGDAYLVSFNDEEQEQSLRIQLVADVSEELFRKTDAYEEAQTLVSRRESAERRLSGEEARKDFRYDSTVDARLAVASAEKAIEDFYESWSGVR